MRSRWSAPRSCQPHCGWNRADQPPHPARPGRNRRRLVEDRRPPASNIWPSCLAEQGEGPLDFRVTCGFSGNPLVNGSQFVGCRLVSGVGEFCFYFKRKLGQLVLPVVRPGGHAGQDCLNLIFGHGGLYAILVGPFRTMLYRSMPPMQRYLTSRNSSMPYFDPSRPILPSNGTISVEMMPSLCRRCRIRGPRRPGRCGRCRGCRKRTPARTPGGGGVDGRQNPVGESLLRGQSLPLPAPDGLCL